MSSESDSSQGKGVSTEEEDNAEVGKSEIETSSDEQEVSDGEEQQEHRHTQETLTSLEYEDTIPESDSWEKVQTTQQSSARTAPRKTAPRKTPAGCCPQRKSC